MGLGGGGRGILPTVLDPLGIFQRPTRPTVPSVTPPVPVTTAGTGQTAETAPTTADIARRRRLRAAAPARRGTILTSPRGVLLGTAGQTAPKTLLGL